MASFTNDGLLYKPWPPPEMVGSIPVPSLKRWEGKKCMQKVSEGRDSAHVGTLGGSAEGVGWEKLLEKKWARIWRRLGTVA